MADLPFPRSLPEFQKLFPTDAACAAYLEAAKWREGFVCGHCNTAGEPFRFEARPGVLRCRKCRKDNRLTAGTVMEGTHTPLSVWFWAAYLVSSQTPGMSAVQFQRQLGLTRYETAFQILHKLRAGMVRPDADRIGRIEDHVEVDECWVGGKTRGEGRGVHDLSRKQGRAAGQPRPNGHVEYDDFGPTGSQSRVDSLPLGPVGTASLGSHLREYDGVPARLAERCREAYGDSVLPQLTEAVGRAILQVDAAMALEAA